MCVGGKWREGISIKQSKVFVVCQRTIQKWHDYHHIHQAQATSVGNLEARVRKVLHAMNFVIYPKEKFAILYYILKKNLYFTKSLWLQTGENRLHFKMSHLEQRD